MKSTTKVSVGNIERNVGIDVGKDTLDIYIYELNKHWQVDNTLECVKSLVRQLKRYPLTRVVVEATGGSVLVVVLG
jgi:transposase